MYGDEVTGKYSEDQIDQLINRGRIDEEYFNQNQMVLRKDGLNELSKKITDFQIDLNNKQQADFDLLSVKLTENYNNSDASRWNLIPQLDRYKDQNSYLQDLSLVQSMEKSLRNAESNSRIISRNSSIDLEFLKSSVFSFVMPTPGSAAFSPFTTTKSIFFFLIIFGKFSDIAFLPEGPTISPSNKIFISIN